MFHVKVTHRRASKEVLYYYMKYRRAGLGTGMAYEAMFDALDSSGHALYCAGGEEPSPRGGMTKVCIFYGETLVGGGYTICSMEDSFCRKTGTKLALKHAIVNGNLNPSEWIGLACKYGEEYVGSVLLAQYDKKCSTQHS